MARRTLEAMNSEIEVMIEDSHGVEGDVSDYQKITVSMNLMLTSSV